MDWKHAAILVVALLAGFYLAKKFPNALSGVPVLGPFLG